MSLAWSEYLRTQIERPLLQRHFFFALVSALLLFPLSLLWSFFATVRAARRKKLSTQAPNEAWIVSIGNVSVGGTGKSPVLRAVARFALSSGYDVAVFTRGVGHSGKEPFLLAIDSAMAIPSAEAWRRLSDETLEHLLQLQVGLPSGAKLWIAQGSQRAELYRSLLRMRETTQVSLVAERKRPLLVLVDDGLQQTALPVHRDVVVWDPYALTIAPRCALPFGPYRAGWPTARLWAKSIPVADVVIWSRMRSLKQRSAFEKQVQKAEVVLSSGLGRAALHHGVPGEPLVTERQPQLSAVERTCLAKVLTKTPAPGFAIEEALAEQWPNEVSLLCGIARPERFENSYAELCSQVGQDPSISRVLRLADHGALDASARAFVRESRAVVTTVKDLCRWWQTPEFQELMGQQRLFVLCLEIDLIPATAESSTTKIEDFFPVTKQ